MHATHEPSSDLFSSFQRLRARGKSPRGFSLTELLVVIAIIVLLVGLLLVALKQVRIKTLRTATEATMRQFANACTAFHAEHGFYPGVVPDSELAFHEQATGGPPPISSTESALLHLMGGCRVLSPADTNPASLAVISYNTYGTNPTAPTAEITITGTQGPWKIKLKVQSVANVCGDTAAMLTPSAMGEGPEINGKPYAPYFTPGPNDLRPACGQLGEAGGSGGPIRIPDLVDAWGQPIVLVKQSRDRGPLVNDVNATGTPTPLPQFALGGVNCYLKSDGLGEMGLSQKGPRGSILSLGTTSQQGNTFGTVLGHPGSYQAPTGGQPSRPLYGAPQGALMLLSGGPDGIYLSAADGPGSAANLLTTTTIDTKVINVGPKVINDFDDVRVFSGG